MPFASLDSAGMDGTALYAGANLWGAIVYEKTASTH